MNKVISKAIIHRYRAYLRYFLSTLSQCFFSDNKNETEEIVIKRNTQNLQNKNQKKSEKLRYVIEKIFKSE